MDDYDGVRRYGGAYGRQPFSFAKTDSTRCRNFKSGTGIPPKMDVTSSYLVFFRLFSYGIHWLLSLQSQPHRSNRERARFYKKTIKNRNVFIYKKAYTFQKARQFVLRFYTKNKTLYVTGFFMKILKLAVIYKKHDTLRYVTFLYTKSLTIRKKQDNLWYVFIQKSGTLRYAIFHRIFEICGGGGGI